MVMTCALDLFNHKLLLWTDWTRLQTDIFKGWTVKNTSANLVYVINRHKAWLYRRQKPAVSLGNLIQMLFTNNRGVYHINVFERSNYDNILKRDSAKLFSIEENIKVHKVLLCQLHMLRLASWKNYSFGFVLTSFFTLSNHQKVLRKAFTLQLKTFLKFLGISEM